MNIRFTHLQGSMTNDEFEIIMKKTRYRNKTKAKLRRFFIDGIRYSHIPGSSRQFIYKKLVELEDRGLINATIENTLAS